MDKRPITLSDMRFEIVPLYGPRGVHMARLKAWVDADKVLHVPGQHFVLPRGWPSQHPDPLPHPREVIQYG
jgi:hypothetical protein